MPTYGNFQRKVLAKIVHVLQQDAYLISKVGGRVYPTNLSSLNEPTFPCVTVSFSMKSDPSIREIEYSDLVIEVWSKKDQAELWSIYSDHDYDNNVAVGIRRLLHEGPSGEANGFDIPEAVISLCREREVDDNLYESWSRTHHLMALYELVFAAKRI